MSGLGVFSVRLPESIVQTIRRTANQRGQGVNDFVRNVLAGLVGLSGADIQRIPEPPLEAVNPRLSFYLGREKLKELYSAASKSGLSPSSVLRKALHAALTRDLLPLAQSEENSATQAQLALLILLMALFAVLIAACLYALHKQHKKRMRMVKGKSFS